jgi:pSer/pThr/pTyr-binding forkhead associated (FHA) protein
MADEPACCGACAHLARVAHDGPAARPATPPLRFELGPDGAPLGAVLVHDDRAVPIIKPSTTIGRGAASDIVIRDANLSRITCRIEVAADGRCYVADMGSTCGTVVNDRRVDRAGLHEGDLIRLADHVLRVERR